MVLDSNDEYNINLIRSINNKKYNNNRGSGFSLGVRGVSRGSSLQEEWTPSWDSPLRAAPCSSVIPVSSGRLKCFMFFFSFVQSREASPESVPSL